MVLRRSADGGRTWGFVQILFDDGDHSLNNPCVMQIRTGTNAGRVLLMFQRFPSGCHTNCTQPGYTGTKICRTYSMYSDDEGATWSNRTEITRMVKRPTLVTSTAAGPGIGIQKRHAPHAGRLIFPFNQRDSRGRWDVYAVFSDDGGKTFAYGAVASSTQTPGTGNEVQMVELPDGSLRLNSRSNGGTKHRKVATSIDGGATWSALRDDVGLIEPQVMGSVLRFTEKADGFARNRVLYAGPNSRSARVNGAVHLSFDGGVTWPHSKVISSDFYAYSCLTDLDGRELGCLFETGGYASIDFARFSVEWLTDGLDCLANGRHLQSYGRGCAGSGKFVPVLVPSGCPTPRAELSLCVDRGLGGSSALLMLGQRRGSVPVSGCTLLVEPLLGMIGPFALVGVGPGNGAASYRVTVPALPLRYSFTLQALTLDAGVARGFAASSGIEVWVF
jgi:sialidase-1